MHQNTNITSTFTKSINALETTYLVIVNVVILLLHYIAENAVTYHGGAALASFWWALVYVSTM
jgi:hypothetical protein